MSKLPALPKGMTPADFGRDLMAWGTGDAAAESRMETLTAEKLRDAGITAAIAEGWRLFFLEVIRETPKNPSARGRTRLMEYAKTLLEEDQ